MIKLIPARAEEIDEIDGFLAPLTATSMFLRSNIRAHGVTGGANRIATRIWLDREGPKLVGVVGLTTGGVILTQMPLLEPSGMHQAAATLVGMAVTGISGESRQAQAFRAAAGLEAEAALGKDEWLYEVDLADLVSPPGGAAIRAAKAADVPLLELWRAAYHVEALGTAPSAAAELARRDVAAMLAADTCRLIERDGVPVGMTALNATVPGWVQVGGRLHTP